MIVNDIIKRNRESKIEKIINPLNKKKNEVSEEDKIKCAHYKCPNCHGTGRKKDGSLCIHLMSCNCPMCYVYYTVKWEY